MCLVPLHPSSCKCSSVSLGFRTERSVAGLKEPFDLLVAVRNDSSSKVSSLKIQLLQECRWTAQGHHA